MDLAISILLVVVGVVTGSVGSVVVHKIKQNHAENKAEQIIEKAKKEAEKAKRQSLFEAKEEAHKLKLDVDKEIKEKKNELKESEQRLMQRESNMDKRDEAYQKRENLLDERDEKLSMKQQEIQNEKVKVEEIKQQQLDLLEKISGFSKDKARKLVMEKVEETMAGEITAYIKDRENEAKLESNCCCFISSTFT